ncbi:MAG: DUF4113 domain-containing protein [Pseudomonas sp.]|nr:DUF4113 domain-containing protein [uncultured Pseudomonas sp.]
MAMPCNKQGGREQRSKNQRHQITIRVLVQICSSVFILRSPIIGNINAYDQGLIALQACQAYVRASEPALCSVPANPDGAMRRELMSQSYTTRLDQLWSVSCRYLKVPDDQ